eukprot:TRINITY_DN2556_c0_g1_i1.p1 TRINITY_DN2556_c0_g1~~TRINITY_DN2556_c0_g1_i1.p1  ORF type:complete len:215 (-),score=101.95 TRINITY_DN2556_c0_g1_i1:56-700(-)
MNTLPSVNEPADLGTSIMAVTFAGGVVIAADSRTSMGSYVSNRISDKLTRVQDKIYCCRSGSAADTQYVAEYVRYILNLHSIQLGEPALVHTAAGLFRKIIFMNKNNFLAAIICAGWDEKDGGSIYQVGISGTLVKQPFAISGSGSSYIYGFCDANWKPNMTKEEALTFAKNAISLAMSRDGSSGGSIKTAVITQSGVEKGTVPGNQLPTFYSD